jgi:hypothetical protein
MTTGERGGVLWGLLFGMMVGIGCIAPPPNGVLFVVRFRATPW